MHVGADLNHFTRHFMAEHHARVRPRQVPGAMQYVVMANPSRRYFNQHFRRAARAAINAGGMTTTPNNRNLMALTCWPSGGTAITQSNVASDPVIDRSTPISGAPVVRRDIRANATRQYQQTRNIRGRVNEVSSDVIGQTAIGWFGWTAGQPDLNQQNLSRSTLFCVT